MQEIDICVVSSGDWKSPSRVNCHEIAARWTAWGEVDYLEPAPLRPPFTRDVKRGLRRLTAALCRRTGRTGSGLYPERLHVHDAVYLPWHPTHLVRSINVRCARVALQPALRRKRGRPWDVLWFFSPGLAGLERLINARLVVYHAVDDYSANPGVRAAAVHDAELSLVRRSDVVFASSRPLAARLKKLHPRVFVLPNVADTERFPVLVPPPRDGRPRVAGFVGNLAYHKVNFALLLDVAQRSPEWRFVLAGPVTALDGSGTALLRRPNVLYAGVVAREEVPVVFRDVDVALLPTPEGPLGESSFPMKLIEYFAMGLPVVGSVPESISGLRDLILPALTVEEYCLQMTRAYELRRDVAYVARLRQEAERRSWGMRMKELYRIVSAELAARR